METLLQDIRYGLRMLRKAPGFTAVAVITLALGIGANTALFTFVDAVVLRLPIYKPQELLSVENQYPDSSATPTSLPDFLEWRAQNHSFQQLVATFSSRFTYRGKEEPVRLFGTYFSDGSFAALGVRPLLGRLPNRDEHRLHAAPVCLLGEQFWRKEFGGDASILGHSLALEEHACTVVGVMPSAVSNFRTEPAAVWLPLEPNPPYDRHGTNYLTVIGRLKPGVTAQQATADLESIQKGIDARFPGIAHGFHIESLTSALFGDLRPLLLLLAAAVGAVLLIACANLANLLLARGTGRAKEFAIREAVGARRWHLVRQLLTEAFLLSAGAAVAATFLSLWSTRLFLRYWPADLHRPESIALDGRVLLFTAGIAIAATALAAVLPAFRTSGGNLDAALRDAGRQTTTSPGNRRVRSAFVVSELSLSVLLLIASLLTLRSFDRMIHADPGFNAEGLLTAGVSLPTRYSDPQARAFFSQLLQRVSNLPGVGSAAAASYVPLGSGGQTGDFTIAGRSFPSGQNPFAEESFVTPEYFRTLHINLLKGRYFTAQDRSDSAKVVMVNRYLADELWPGQNPIGKRISVLLPAGQWQEVVGVVADVKSSGPAAPSMMQIYLPFYQLTPSSMTLVVRAEGDATPLIAAVKGAVHQLDPDLAVANVSLMDQLVAQSVSRPRSGSILMTVFAGLSLLLAAVGLYGVMAYSVGQRVHEIGLRMALGASSGHVLRIVLGAAARLCLMGVAAGLIAAFVLTRYMRSLVYGIRVTDPASYALAAVFLLAVALLASYLPARRASKVDPMVALRYE